MTTRREFVEQSALSALSAVVAVPSRLSLYANDDQPTSLRGFVNVVRMPDAVAVHTVRGEQQLIHASGDNWSAAEGILVGTSVRNNALEVSLSSPQVAIKRVHLRWRGPLMERATFVGDAWERGYGDLEWRGWVPDRIMPWYFASSDGSRTDAYGVRTGANAFCSWQVDRDGISLWADVRSGGVGVQLGERVLHVCDALSRAGRPNETAFAATRAFCRQMCANPRMPSQPVYGSNDWYWAYGKNSADSVRADVQHIVELSPSGSNRPFVVIDDGWQPGRGKDKAGAGLWDHGNDKFGDMQALAADVRKGGARAGIWIRPLQGTADAPESWKLSREKGTLDPTVPDVLDKVAADIARLRTWGYELIKHDYTTFDLFGRWGSTMGSAMTREGWSFASGASHTTAEVITTLYATIRKAAAESLVIGCNTVSHLSAGQFEICRVGDDTSGTEWSRTRKMGVNSLAFRAAQHGTFYVADADCVGVTNAQPWALNRQWLDLLSRSGTMLFVSLAPDALGADQRRDLREALARAAEPQPLAEPLDWQHTVYPEHWRAMGSEKRYDWVGEDGAGLPST